MYYPNLEGRSIESHAIKNRLITERWWELPDAEKATFYDRSKVSQSSTVSPECFRSIKIPRKKAVSIGFGKLSWRLCTFVFPRPFITYPVLYNRTIQLHPDQTTSYSRVAF